MQQVKEEVRIAPSAGTKGPTQFSPAEIRAMKEREREEVRGGAVFYAQGTD